MGSVRAGSATTTSEQTTRPPATCTDRDRETEEVEHVRADERATPAASTRSHRIATRASARVTYCQARGQTVLARQDGARTERVDDRQQRGYRQQQSISSVNRRSVCGDLARLVPRRQRHMRRTPDTRHTRRRRSPSVTR